MPRSALIFALALASFACGRPDDGATPEGAVQAYFEAMEVGRWDSTARARAFSLVDPVSRAELESRASRLESLGRSGVEPWELLAQGTFRPRFRPEHYAAGEDAVVVSRGSDSASIPVVWEDTPEGGGWRVVLFDDITEVEAPQPAGPSQPADHR